MTGTRLEILERMLLIYDEIIGKYSFECGKGCSSCCTRNVTVTSLEAFRIARKISDEKRTDLLEALEKTSLLPRFIPKTTANGFAAIMMSGADEPEEIVDPSWKPCPFLDSQGICGIYDARPFNCRCMHSEQKCEEDGFSVLPPFVVTLNNVFLQYIEHLDKNGFFANMTDAVLWMAEESGMESYEKNGSAENAPESFPRCIPMPFLMVPPEHRAEIRPVLEKISGTARS